MYFTLETHLWEKKVAEKKQNWTIGQSKIHRADLSWIFGQNSDIQECSTAPSLGPPLVSDDGVVRGVDHRGVVDGGEITIHQVKFVHAQQSRPDGFDLDVGKVLPNATVAAWWERPKQMF